MAPLGPSPELGQHTAEVLDAVPVGAAAAGSAAHVSQRIDVESPRSLDSEPTPASLPAPLAGVKVADLTWYMAGPATTRMMADWGATSCGSSPSAGPTAGAVRAPSPGGKSDPDAGGYGLTHNSGKLGLALDLTKPDSRPVLEDLLRWADVAVVNYSPRATRNLRLDWASLSELNPELILVSTCLMGQSGPLAEFAGFGNLSAAVAGFYEVGGWPDRPPVGPYLAYTDVVAPRFTFCSILAALDERRRTGRGRYLDVSQAEAAMWLLAPDVVDHQLTGRFPTRVGNDDPNHAPHGVYPAAGEDRWVAVACTTDEQWAALAGAIGAEAQLGDLIGCDHAARVARAAELDDRLARWTEARPAEEVESRLIAAGVPAHTVVNSTAAGQDPHLRAQGHFVIVDHPVHTTCVVEGPRVRLSRTPGQVTRAGPRLGEHTDEILRGLLGYDDERIAALAVAGALD